jgi:hypothetical protein
MGTFNYGASYYGLRAYDQTTGAVKDASATATSTSSVPSVNWEVHIGSGQLTITSASSTTCSGESFILEETDKFSYGTGLYGVNEYDQADLQTIVSATSSIASVAGVRIQNGSAVSSATSTLICLGGMRFSGNVSVVATSTFASNGVRYREGSATVTSSASISSSSTATLIGNVSITATSTVSANAEKFFLESSDKFSYGTGLYGMNEYDEADLQTIVSATSSTSVASGIRVQNVIASTQIVHITVTNSHVDGSHKYFIDSVQQPTLDLVEGTTYTFSYSSSHPFSFSTTSDGTHNSGSEYTTGTTRDTSANTLTFICPDNAPQLYYYCSVHSGMGGTANTNPQTVVTASAEKINLGVASMTSSSASTVASVFVASVGGSLTSTSSTTIVSFIRERNAYALVSVTSGTLTIAREKWEDIAPTATTWTDIAA